MRRLSRIRLTTVLMIAFSLNMRPQPAPSASASTYLGFDRNDYPGDENLKLLRQTFSYAGFWLNHPPGEEDQHLGREAAGVAIGRLRISRAVQRTALRRIENSFPMPAGWANRMPRLPSPRRGAKAFPQERSSFWTRKKAAGCCLSRRLISTPGWTASPQPVSAPAFIAPASRPKKMRRLRYHR